jgi:hypothetical protein
LLKRVLKVLRVLKVSGGKPLVSKFQAPVALVSGVKSFNVSRGGAACCRVEKTLFV